MGKYPRELLFSIFSQQRCTGQHRCAKGVNPISHFQSNGKVQIQYSYISPNLPIVCFFFTG